MLAFFPGEVQVLTPSAGVLQVVYPLDVITAGALSLSVCFVLFMARVLYKKNGKLPWFAVVLAAFTFYFCLDALSYRGTITVSQADRTIRIDERSFYYQRSATYPIASFNRAVAETGSSRNRQLVLLTPSGQSVHFGNGFTGRSGIDHAAYVLNAVLSRDAQP
ncbi:hypothetical protein [Terriglobus aquaticus]|uniref:PH domain-containing protein n=1 Tax=Terriglobus aquaticus TaxID=940139 RepID=A0ABW9KMH4_9BACT|nr:hypothetical protein [Terriglobus aquaticus]